MPRPPALPEVGSTSSFPDTVFNAAAPAPNRDVFVGGLLDHEGFVARHDAAGNTIWMTRFGYPGPAVDSITADERRVVVGTSTGSIHQFDLDGDLEWVSEEPGLSQVTALDIAPDGSVYAAGLVYAPVFVDEDRSFVSRLDAGGNADWTLIIDETTNHNTHVGGMAALSDGSVAVAFHVNGPPLTENRTVAIVFDEQGKEVWSDESVWPTDFLIEPVVGREVPTGVTATPDGGFVIVGHKRFHTVNDSWEGIIAAYDASYQQRWFREVGEPESDEQLHSVIVGPDGMLYATGGLASPPALPVPPSQPYVVSFTPDGTLRWTATTDPGEIVSGRVLVPSDDGRFSLVSNIGTSANGGYSVDYQHGVMQSVDFSRLDAGIQTCLPGTDHPFTDIGTSGRLFDDAGCLFQLDVTTGTGTHSYDPGSPVTREQMGAFLARMYRTVSGNECPWVYPDNYTRADHPSAVVFLPFGDLRSTSFAFDDIGCIFSLGITTGTRPTTYSPGEQVTRLQMAAFIARLYRTLTGDTCNGHPMPFVDVDVTAFAYDDIACIYALGITTGTSPQNYSPGDPVTRDQMASFLARFYRLLVD